MTFDTSRNSTESGVENGIEKGFGIVSVVY